MNTLKEIVEYINTTTTPSTQKAANTINNIRAQVKNYVERNKLKSLVVGISGGLDSSVIAALCQEEFTGVPLIGVSIPMSSSTAHKEQAQWVGDNYCTAFEEFKGWDEDYFTSGEAEAFDDPTNMISEIFLTLTQTDSIAAKAGFEINKFPTKVLAGNMKARLRMITLYHIARGCNGIVLSTDNLSEFQAGFFTINGDVGDYGPIQNIGKGFELPSIAKELGVREDIITQAPSDGLMVTDDDTDEAQLGANYQEFDTIMGVYLGTLPVADEIKSQLKSQMFNLVETDISGAKKVAKVISRYESMGYKRRGTLNLTREQIGLN